MVPKQRGSWQPPDFPHWVGGLFTFRVERVGPFEAGQGPSWFECWVRTENEGDKFQEEEKARWVNAFPSPLGEGLSRNVDARDTLGRLVSKTLGPWKRALGRMSWMVSDHVGPLQRARD
jgi:hypothetical protein